MLTEKIKIHDNFQFEIKQSYKLSTEERENSKYSVQIYFFIPLNLNINSETYFKTDFYKDIRANIRLMTPHVPLERFSGLIERLDASSKLLLVAKNEESYRDFEQQTKLFCLTLKKALRYTFRLMKQKKNLSILDKTATDMLLRVKEIRDSFRIIKKLISSSQLHDNSKRMFFFADEYLSLKIESHMFKLIELLQKKDPNLMERHRAAIMRLVKSEIRYRKSEGYPSIPGLEGDNERYIFRQQALKKYISNILYLETRVERDGRYLEQLLYSIAAGVAMIFATTIAFLSQKWYGSLTLPFFIALIVSYMFKDRIKEILRHYFSTTLKLLFFDRKRDIYHRFDSKIGQSREAFHFISEKKLPVDVKRIRGRDIITDINNSMIGEEILLYRKHITFNRKKFKDIKKGTGSRGIIDNFRFNVQNFLRSMDNPQKKISIPSGRGYKKVKGKRVYHINIISHYTIGKRDYYEHFRIVLNREGIKRIEEVESNGRE